MNSITLPPTKAETKDCDSDETLLDAASISSAKEENPPRDIHAFLEEKRAALEQEIGLDRLLRVYNMIAELEQSAEDDKAVDYAALATVLGEGNEHHIDGIIQLVVADNFFWAWLGSQSG